MATILAIGVAALLLMLGIAFVTTSMIERKAAVNFQNINVARAFAQTAFNRAMANMKLESANPQESMNEILSHDNDIVNDASMTDAGKRAILGDDLANQLTTVVNGDTILIMPSDYPSNTAYNITDTSAVTWVYIKSEEQNDFGDNDGQIFGRVAYVVLPDKGKIDPWAVIDSGSWSTTTNKPPSEYLYGNGKTSKDSLTTYVTGRPGKNINELSLASLEYDSETFYPSYTQKMSVNTCSPVGLVNIGDAGKWKDYEQIFSNLGISQSNDTIRQYFREVFYVNAPEDDEKYWVDANKDVIREQLEMQPRFDLVHADSPTWWNNRTVSDFGGDAPQLKWILNMNDTVTKNQIIANLIDYCDSDTNATTDNPNNPGYFGLERCPYINEVRVSVPFTITKGSKTNNLYPWTISSTGAIVAVELVNMYGFTLSGTNLPKATINLELEYYIGTSGTEVAFNPQPGMETQNLLFNSINSTYTTADTMILGTDFKNNQYNLATSTTALGIKVNVKNFSVLLKSSDGLNNYDFARFENNDISQYQVFNYSTAPTTNPAYYYSDYEVRDPRQNLNTTDWIQIQVAPASATASAAANGTLLASGTTLPAVGGTVAIGKKNAVFPTTFSGTDTDIEAAADPWLISTAYIRNDHMQSPWELGFIHRASNFQTINLKKYNDSTDGYGFGPAAAAGDYSLGDANILDQIKMSSNSTTLGKINLNSDNTSVLRTLFDQINIGSTKVDPGSGGTNITSPNDLAIETLNVNGTHGSGNAFYTRAQIVHDIPNLSNGHYGTQTTDATQEELIGKFINLTKVETPDLFTVIAVGQAIKDVGPDSGTVTIYKDLNNDGDVSDPGETIAAKKGQFDVNADEVTASQKILARIKRTTGTDTFYIQDLMYLDQ